MPIAWQLTWSGCEISKVCRDGCHEILTFRIQHLKKKKGLFRPKICISPRRYLSVLRDKKNAHESLAFCKYRSWSAPALQFPQPHRCYQISGAKRRCSYRLLQKKKKFKAMVNGVEPAVCSPESESGHQKFKMALPNQSILSKLNKNLGYSGFNL